ncbi:serine/threonine protein kinase [Microseira sp. BLCC-F43]|uniref:serine/threonine protein kinase n=1 Tax=Microseira sp. BLCC-F43 TaxID=3153602 RepID=UPI0035B97F6C
MTWTFGQKLQGSNYTIEKVLGEGSFGITYLARNENNRRVVIKTLNDRAQQRPDFDKLHQDFLNDALRLARCTHPHIVRVEELIEERGLFCMVMEYIEGEDLASRVENQGILQEDEALRYIEQIGAALIAVHDRGLLHRDVNPQNIMLRSPLAPLDKGGSPLAPLHKGGVEAVLIDFSIAREVGSDCFAPIEQYEKETKLGVYTDVYGLAATLYAILTGELPVAAPARAENTPLIAPKQLNPDISDRINQAILQGMAFQPHERPQSIQEWLQLLYKDPVTSPQSSTSTTRQQSPTKTVFSQDFPWGLLAGVLLSCGWIGFALAQIMAPGWVWSLVLACALIPQISGYAIAIFGSLAAGVLALNLIVEPSSKTLSNLPLLATAVSLSEMAVWYSALGIIYCAFSTSFLQQLKTLFSKFNAVLILTVTSWLGIGLGRLLGFMFE